MFATIAAISVGGYISLASTELRLANRSLYFNAALNLAEAGAEEAMYGINQGEWSRWHIEGDVATLTLEPEHFQLGKAASGTVTVRVENYNASPPNVPQITADGRVKMPNGSELSKQIRITLFQRSLFGNGMMAKDGFSFKGKFAMNSYDSRHGTYDSIGNEEYRNLATLGSLSLNTLELDQAQIHGSVFTGSLDDPDLHRNHGLITGEITTDFDADLKDSPEADSNSILVDPIASSLTLDGSSWRTSYIELKGGGTNTPVLTIRSHVELHVTGDIDISGAGQILIEHGASLTLYVDGDINLTGKGMINESNTPDNLTIFGTNSGEQNFKLYADTAKHAAIYAPNAHIEMRGQMLGSVVGKTITTGGDMSFHHDLSLSQKDYGQGYAMRTWQELFDDRIAF